MKKKYENVYLSVVMFSAANAVIVSGPERFDNVVADEFGWWQR